MEEEKAVSNDKAFTDEKVALLKDDDESLETVNNYFKLAFDDLKMVNSNAAISYAKWTKDKIDLHFKKEIDDSLFIVNNGIYWAFLGENIGSEQGMHRPVLIVHTERKSPTCAIIPLTLERLNDGYWYHVDLENSNSTALVEQLKVISKKRIDEPIYERGSIKTITDTDWEKINEQLARLYSLKPLIKNFKKRRKKY